LRESSRFGVHNTNIIVHCDDDNNYDKKEGKTGRRRRKEKKQRFFPTYIYIIIYFMNVFTNQHTCTLKIFVKVVLK
jgi:hypothetical protein